MASSGLVVALVALVRGLAAMISAVLLGATVFFLLGVDSQEMGMSLMLSPRDQLSNFPVLAGGAYPSSCAAV